MEVDLTVEMKWRFQISPMQCERCLLKLHFMSPFSPAMHCVWRDLFIMVFVSHETTKSRGHRDDAARPSRFPLC